MTAGVPVPPRDPGEDRTGDDAAHEVTGVEYVPVCDQCWKPAEQYDIQDANGQWRHGGFRHLPVAPDIAAAAADALAEKWEEESQ